MNHKFYYFIACILLGLGTFSCQNKIEGVLIQGQIDQANNIQAYFDKVTLNKANAVIEKAMLGPDGSFEFAFPEGLEPGIYAIRIGTQKATLILDGNEGLIEMQSSMQNLKQNQVAFSGSPHSSSYYNMLNGLNQRKYTSKDLASYIDTTASPFTSAMLTYQMGTNLQSVPFQEKAVARLVANHPENPSTKGMNDRLTQMKKQAAIMQANEKIKVGQPAPDISLPSPTGVNYALSDLKGQIILLDFWASWCGPCRRENPNVVKVYEKYKDQGFTVYSVSLDGLDSRTKARLKSQDQINEMMKSSKQRWVDAIAKDNLTWKYHVSDLKKWDADPAATYGVRSIPSAFLIDRDGNIAYTKVRGAADLESKLKSLL